MESVNKKVLLIAVFFALFTSFLIYNYIKNSTAKPETVEYKNVYVAIKTLPAKHKIADGDIRLKQVRKEYLSEKAALNKADIIGKRLKDRIIEGEQILTDRLADDNNMALAYNVPDGKRAVSVSINEQIGVSNLLKPGDFVDVVASFEKEEVESGMTKITYPKISKIIIQDVQVLALGQEQAITDESAKDSQKTVTLAVMPQETEKLVYASEYGVVRLALRPIGDNIDINTEGIIRSDLVPNKGMSVANK